MAASQYRLHTKQPLVPVVARQEFSNGIISVNTGAFPAAAAADRVAMAAASFSKVLDFNGDITLDDANDQLVLGPGVYEVELKLRFRDAVTDSDFSVALTDADAATNHWIQTNVHGGVLSGGLVDTVAATVLLSLPSGGRLELHAAATTASGGVQLRAGSAVVVRRIGNPS